MEKIINVEDYRSNGAAGYLLTWDDGVKTAINAYNSQWFDLEGVKDVECVCGWDEADKRLALYTEPEHEPVNFDNLLKDLEELQSID